MNQLLSISITFILWQAYSIIEGRRDGFYYHAATMNGDSNSHNLHPLFTVMRATFGTSLIFGFIGEQNWTLLLLMCAFMIFTFSYWHNGEYYKTRHELDPKVYPKGWSSTSTTSRATFDLSFNQRCLLLVIGILFFVLAIINVLINR